MAVDVPDGLTKMVRARPRYIAVIAFMVVATSLYFLKSMGDRTQEAVHGVKAQTPSTADPLRSFKASNMPPGADDMHQQLASLFKSIKLDPTQPYFRDSKGTYFDGGRGHNMVWKESIGKRLLIVDIDTRIPKDGNQILNPDLKPDFKTSDSLVSNSIMNHYIYAMIHGYDYAYYQALPIPDHHATWTQPHAFRTLLPKYDFVVNIDADALVHHLEVPLEWLFNRWGFGKNTSLAAPLDTEQFKEDGTSISQDSFGVPVLNTGFVVAQNLNRTHEILEAWTECTSEVRYPGCAHWKYNWSHEQRALSEYIRWDFGRTPGTILELPCDDAMGYPEFEADYHESGKVNSCVGNFISHYTAGKVRVHQATAEIVMQAMSEVIKNNLINPEYQMVIKEEKPIDIGMEKDIDKGSVPWENPKEAGSNKGNEDELYDDLASEIEADYLV